MLKTMILDSDLDDSMDGFFGDAGREIVPMAERVAPIEIPLEVFYDKCKSCGGGGNFRSYTGRIVGPCFKCKGAGKIAYKTPTAKREIDRANAASRKSAAARGWADENAAVWAWIIDRAPRFDFAASMRDSVGKYGSLTERQLAAVLKLMVADEERAAARKAAPVIAPVAVEITKVVEAFALVMSKGIKAPKLHLDTFRFSPAKAHSANAGAIYVTEDETYLGKIIEGKFQRSRDCDAETETRILAAAADPAGAALAYGHRTGCCSICKRELTVKESVERGIGPICADRFGF